MRGKAVSDSSSDKAVQTVQAVSGDNFASIDHGFPLRFADCALQVGGGHALGRVTLEHFLVFSAQGFQLVFGVDLVRAVRGLLTDIAAVMTSVGRIIGAVFVFAVFSSGRSASDNRRGGRYRGLQLQQHLVDPLGTVFVVQLVPFVRGLAGILLCHFHNVSQLNGATGDIVDRAMKCAGFQVDFNARLLFFLLAFSGAIALSDAQQRGNVRGFDHISDMARIGLARLEMVLNARGFELYAGTARAMEDAFNFHGYSSER
nr:MAG TPA_asm: hypothetical protein [Caudoviricetes sp.]